MIYEIAYYGRIDDMTSSCPQLSHFCLTMTSGAGMG